MGVQPLVCRQVSKNADEIHLHDQNALLLKHNIFPRVGGGGDRTPALPTVATVLKKENYKHR